jgi:hypothetical protein
MTCALCSQPIAMGDALNMHHPIYRSNGGTDTQPTHKACHVALHSLRNDFAEWGRIGGKISAASKRWAFNLKNVRTHPAYEGHRLSYLMTYAQAGWSAGLII